MPKTKSKDEKLSPEKLTKLLRGARKRIKKLESELEDVSASHERILERAAEQEKKVDRMGVALMQCLRKLGIKPAHHLPSDEG